MTVRSVLAGFTQRVKDLVKSFTSPSLPEVLDNVDAAVNEVVEVVNEVVEVVDNPIVKERIRMDAVVKAEELHLKNLQALDQTTSTDLYQEAKDAASRGTPSAGRGHPSLIPPQELLVRYEGMRPDDAAALIERTLPNHNLIFDALRAKHRRLYVKELTPTVVTPATQPIQPTYHNVQTYVGLSGKPIAFTGDLNVALRFVFDKWVSSPWAGTTSPPQVGITLANGRTFVVPNDVFAGGASSTIRWLEQQLNDTSTDWWVGQTSLVYVLGWVEEEYKLFQAAFDLTDREIRV